MGMKKLSSTIHSILLIVLLVCSCTTGRNVTFSENYINEHKGKFEVQVPEVQELSMILVALSHAGRNDSSLVDMKTAYHKKVLEAFTPYAKHPIIDILNKYIVDPGKNENSGWYFYSWKMNACAYTFTGDDKIVHAGVIKKMGFNNMPDPISKNIPLLEDFARKSGFRKFYAQNKSYYDSMVTTYEQLDPIDKMCAWLKGKFGIEYGNYTIMLSPLVSGWHATQQFKDKKFKQTFMFVCPSKFLPAYDTNVNEMIWSRVVFTEIDHNFVNPLSHKNARPIRKAFAVRSRWVKDADYTGSSSYKTAEDVFNEYMTWAVFSLYCIDNYPEADVKIHTQKMEKQMVEKRGFVNFPAFNQKLISIYMVDRAITMQQLYDQMLLWCGNSNS